MNTGGVVLQDSIPIFMSVNLKDSSVRVVKSRTIAQTPKALYRFWRDLKNLEKIIRHPVEITVISDTETHWKVSAPFGYRPVEWDAVIINDEVDHLIAWRSRAGADVANLGSVRFQPAATGCCTEVTVTLEFQPPGGKLAGWFALLSTNEPGRQAADTLRRLGALIDADDRVMLEKESLAQSYT